ncbi:hypothetical protein CHLRE_12g487750v5 [Chlamydomonas reinhardtii]|uniref:Uncharacterized protein n=1 Tax=Chlamydomonas reinhardtii TaxID=3055 RepID=A0A2K3D2C3_CHLRE|nr:uncharacterized protein CHLRE_12g487750v5 [Chlamydomonas reinhardtii]PNW74669.1 hypothetical protein CHLRE_12g487750v5 [Chlamydomonas reinhardtii]
MKEPTAAAADDVGGTSAAKLQGLRSEAMFARIKQQLDELQSSFTHSSNGAAGGAALGSEHSHVGAGLGLGLGLGVGAEAPAAGLRRNGTGGSGARSGGLR